MRALLLLPIALLSAAATADSTALLAGRAAGPPVDCVDQSRVQGPQIVDNQTIVYRQSGHRWWVNSLTETCPSLQPERILIVEVQGGRMCRDDLFRTLSRNSSIPGPICRLGRFVPWDKPAR